MQKSKYSEAPSTSVQKNLESSLNAFHSYSMIADDEKSVGDRRGAKVPQFTLPKDDELRETEEYSDR